MNPTEPSTRLQLVLAIALPVFVVSARTVAEPLAHPWAHLWILAALTVALTVRRLLHRGAADANGWNWHLYFAAAGATTMIGSILWAAHASGSTNELIAAVVVVLATAVAVTEARHLTTMGSP